MNVVIQEKYQFINSNINKFNSGFVAIIGVPNAGKSTLLNFILDSKISITSKKPQTTRNRILGVLTKPSAQFIFIDTPGIIHKTSNLFNTKIVNVAFKAIVDADLILLVIDVSSESFEMEQTILKKLEVKNKPVILVINKIDKINKIQILKKIKTWSNIYKFASIVPVCALNGDQVNFLIYAMKKNLPKSPPMFSNNIITNMSEKFIISEIIREKIFRLTGQEIPYSSAVTIDNLKYGLKNSLTHVYASIYVERNTQKGMIIGKHGSKIKQIGKLARLEIQKLIGLKVFLKLFIKVQKNWRKDTKALEKFGY